MSAAPFSPHQTFADNLRALCTRHGSIAAVCRALGMNRQQFNKYLAGSTLPNGATLERICGFFAIEPQSLFRDPLAPDTQALPGSTPAGTDAFAALPCGTRQFASAALGRMRNSSLRPGCYYFYFPWARDPAKCVRAALYVYRRGGLTLFTRFTKFRSPSQRQRYYLRGRHDGVVLESDKAKFLLAMNRKGYGEMSLVSLGVESALSQDFMSGLALVMEASGAPLALRATLEYRGSAAILRRTISDACVLALTDPSIPEEVRQSMSAPPQGGAATLDPFSLFDSLPPVKRRDGRG
jgi:transcriptional regulator with XRE-family HTH domain